MSIQSSSIVGTVKSDTYRIGTGYERVLAHMTRPPFAFTTEEDGRITRYDENSKMVEVTYNSGKKVCFHYGTQICSNSGGGFYLNQPMIPNGIALGKRVKKGDVLAFNDRFFKRDPFTGQVDYKLGQPGYVAFVETDQTYEDSSVVSDSLSRALSFAPIGVREVVLTAATTVHQCVEVGQHVSNTDPLITFDESVAPSESEVGNKELAALLQRLNRATPKVKFNGKVAGIDVFYKCKLSEMSPTLAKLVRDAQKDRNAKAAFAASTMNKYSYMPTEALDVEKVGMVTMNPDTVVLRFYIEHEVPVYTGSKVIYDSSLKSVVGCVLKDDMYTEDGTLRVDAMMSYRSVLARIVNSPMLTGVAASIVEKMEKDILQMAFPTK